MPPRFPLRTSGNIPSERFSVKPVAVQAAGLVPLHLQWCRLGNPDARQPGFSGKLQGGVAAEFQQSGNRFLPVNGTAPAPTAPVPSLYLWQKEQKAASAGVQP